MNVYKCDCCKKLFTEDDRFRGDIYLGYPEKVISMNLNDISITDNEIAYQAEHYCSECSTLMHRFRDLIRNGQVKLTKKNRKIKIIKRKEEK